MSHLHYCQAQDQGRTIYFALTSAQLFPEDIEGPPTLEESEDAVIPIHWVKDNGEVAVDEKTMREINLLEFGPEYLYPRR